MRIEQRAHSSYWFYTQGFQHATLSCLEMIYTAEKMTKLVRFTRLNGGFSFQSAFEIIDHGQKPSQNIGYHWL
jgi:hypothetical protein